ncbi:MAG: O-antigen ligase family protein [Desulfobacterales bacterium]
MRLILLTAAFIVLAFFLGFLSSQIPPATLIWGGVAFAIFSVSFINIEVGLYILIFSMLLSPEIAVGETQGGSLGRGVTLRLEDFLLVVIGFSWFARNAVHKELGLFLKTPLNRAILFYTLACIIATGFGIMTGRVNAKTGFFFVVKYFEYFIVFFMMVNHVRNADQIKRFVFCLLLTCFVTAIIGMLQITAGGRVSAPFEGQGGEPNTFGGYLLFMGAIAAGMLSTADRTRTKHLLAGFIIVIIPPFLFTLSRSSYLAFVPALITLGFLMQKRVIAVGLMVIALALTPVFLPFQIRERIKYTFTQRQHRDQIKIGNVRLDTSTSARIKGWKQAVADWTKHPVLGYGVTGYHFVDAQFPRVLVETGIFGFMAFLYLLFSIGKIALCNLRNIKSPYFKGLTIGFTAGFVGLLFHAIGANTFIIVRIMEPFWFFAGIITVIPLLEKKTAASSQKTQTSPISPVPNSLTSIPK